VKKEKIIVVLGPTASGKTQLAIDLAKELGGEIISADSMQVYKDISVISAKPTEGEKEGIKHHLIDFLSSDKTFSVSDFKTLCEKSINDIIENGKIPIICGGTGLYIDSLINNIHFSEYTENSEIRQKYMDIANTKGNEYLYEILKSKDIEISSRIHQNNTIKVVRALEVMETTGKTMTEIQRKSNENSSNYITLFIGLNYSDRQLLYDRINLRVDNMVNDGLLEEAISLYSRQDVSKTIKQAIGYKELLPHINGDGTLEESIEDIKQYSRRYAKRQITWFKKNKNIKWFNRDKFIDYNHMYTDILKECQHFI